ncbi:hypothetical protein J3R30DRAFT_3446298 [Lentinula aciculospora]|uniref:Uncharacterized protein n=1 Tax=Lentinula aciculospora TaxID=153920 RepID=A0A9W9AMT4_9AGAR|nr:hypothetical protein J3R30DRAFT_3446298 [Lentinula aciculospora]
MVGLPLAYNCAKRASIISSTCCGASASAQHTFSRRLHENGLTDFKRGEIEQGNEESAEVAGSAASDAAQSQGTKIKKRFSDLPKIRVLPDGSIAKPLEQWQSGGDSSLKGFDHGYIEAKDLLQRLKTKQCSEDNTDAIDPDDQAKVSMRKSHERAEEVAVADEDVPKKGTRKKNLVIQKEEIVGDTKPARKKKKDLEDAQDESLVQTKPKRSRKNARTKEGCWSIIS